MGNCFYRIQSRSSISEHPRLLIIEIDPRDSTMTNNMDRSLQLSCAQIIKEEPENEQEEATSPQFGSKFHIENAQITAFVRLQRGPKIEAHHKFKLQNLHTNRYLHSHLIKHMHNKLNEVSTCNNCNYEYDWWQILIVQKRIYIFHPLTNSYLKCLNVTNEMAEVGCHCQERDEWKLIYDDEELRVNSILSKNLFQQELHHVNTGFFLHTQPYQSKIENEHIVTVCKINMANALWRITDIQ